ncbi:MAG: hypothetical protein KIT52_06860 [Anaerolineae bacterium]|nr:hypothetical protein [Anaerolineae bacterium]
MKEQKFTLEEVRAAFQRLEDHVAAQGADADCLWTIHEAVADGIRILAGEWEPEGDALDEDELSRAALEARTPEAFDAAVLRLTALDDRPQVERARREIDPAWRPSPAGNEAMLGALVVYAEKRAGALGRGRRGRRQTPSR